jgi:hypothetical protein
MVYNLLGIWRWACGSQSAELSKMQRMWQYCQHCSTLLQVELCCATHVLSCLRVLCMASDVGVCCNTASGIPGHNVSHKVASVACQWRGYSVRGITGSLLTL